MMVSAGAVQTKFQDLHRLSFEMSAVRDRGEALAALWQQLAAYVHETKDAPPPHLRRLLPTLAKVQFDPPGIGPSVLPL